RKIEQPMAVIRQSKSSFVSNQVAGDGMTGGTGMGGGMATTGLRLRTAWSRKDVYRTLRDQIKKTMFFTRTRIAISRVLMNGYQTIKNVGEAACLRARYGAIISPIAIVDPKANTR